MNISHTNIQGGVNFRTLRDPTIVTGGTKTTDGLYTIRTFTSNGNLVISGGNITGEYLVVAAGGASGSGDATGSGGGGGGGSIYQNPATLPSGTYPIVIGQGTVGNGQPTTAFSVTAVGGGKGGQGVGVGSSGSPGGSGGGGGAWTAPFASGGSGSQGGPGSVAGGSPGGRVYGGGGGGASQAGGQGSELYNFSNGGNGFGSSITGSFAVYAGGGAGHTNNANVTVTNGQGQNNYGGGGQALGTGSSPNNGAAGVVIIRYLTEGTA